MTNLWFFDNVNLFNLLCPHKFREYKECHTFDTYKKSDYIYFEEDAASKVYLIEEGKVKLGYYTEGGIEVVKVILGEEIRNEFAQSVDARTSICPIGVETMHDLMRDNKTFSFKNL
jgi:hypothetical protein